MTYSCRQDGLSAAAAGFVSSLSNLLIEISANLSMMSAEHAIVELFLRALIHNFNAIFVVQK